LSIAGVKMSAFFMEDLYEDFIKISFRSKDDVDVNQFSRKYFNGGGHINAAGGKSLESLRNIETFKNRIAEENYKHCIFLYPFLSNSLQVYSYTC
jgi:phosphoesterase RecJ-like protein